jgi:hypothetical protein
MSKKDEQVAVRLSRERARVIQRHTEMYDTTTADALRAAVDALSARHTDPAADSRKHKIRSNDDTNTLGLDP